MSLNHKFEKNTRKLDKWNVMFLIIISALLISAIVKAIDLYLVTR